MRRHIAGHNGTSADQRMLRDGHATDHDNPGAQCGSLLHNGGQQLSTVALDVCAGAQVIGKDDPRTQEDVIADMNAVEDHHLVLDRDAVAHRGAALNESSVTDVAVAANSCTSEDVGECPDPRPVPDVVAFAQSMWMHEDTVQ
jgi:hypothetical protein